MERWIDAELLLDALWQSSAWLALGLAGARLAARAPARAHGLLLASLVAAVLTPALGLAVRANGWGLLPASPTALAPSSAPPLDGGFAAWRAALPSAALVLAGLWSALSVLCLVRLGLSWLRARDVLATARAVRDPGVLAAAASAARRIGTPRPRVLRSNAVRSPVIWCWGRVPRILLPAQAPADANLSGILCHELAHRRRRDHMTAAAAELLVALLPWQPLAWLAKRRLDELGERCCDAWAVAAGEEPVGYAEALLRLVPQDSRGLVLGARLGRSPLARRVRDLLGDAPCAPRMGRRFALAAVCAFTSAAGAVALAQDAPAALAPPRLPRADEARVLAEALCTDVCAMPAELDLGEVPAGESATGSIWLTNGGTRPWTVLAAEPTCDCTTVTEVAGTLLFPDTAVEIPLAMKAPAQAGRERTQHVDIRVEGHAPIRVPVHVRASADPPR